MAAGRLKVSSQTKAKSDERAGDMLIESEDGTIDGVCGHTCSLKILWPNTGWAASTKEVEG